MGKHIDTSPGDTYEREAFKITRLKGTLYFYLYDDVIPFTKRNCGDDESAIMWYNKIVRVIKNMGSEQKSLWERLKGLIGRG